MIVNLWLQRKNVYYSTGCGFRLQQLLTKYWYLTSKTCTGAVERAVITMCKKIQYSPLNSHPLPLV